MGRAFPELRAVFGRSAQVPDVSFYRKDRLPGFIPGQDFPEISIAPDITIEIRSPGQNLAELRQKIRDALKHGSQLGWLIEPVGRQIGVLRPGQKIQILKLGDSLSGEGDLPGFSIPLAEILGWLEKD